MRPSRPPSSLPAAMGGFFSWASSSIAAATLRIRSAHQLPGAGLFLCGRGFIRSLLPEVDLFELSHCFGSFQILQILFQHNCVRSADAILSREHDSTLVVIAINSIYRLEDGFQLVEAISSALMSSGHISFVILGESRKNTMQAKCFTRHAADIARLTVAGSFFFCCSV